MRLQNILRYSKLVPTIILQTKNWYDVIFSFFKFRPAIIRFRNGLQLNLLERVDLDSLFTVFYKKEYGTYEGNYNVIVDIGGNRGYYALYLTNFSKIKRILSFEPIEANIIDFKNNLALNNSNRKIELIPKGVAGMKEVKTFYLGSSIDTSMIFTSEDREKIQVECLTLNDVFQEYNIFEIDILKIDCEGAEYEILYNCSDASFSKIKNIRMEYHNINNTDLNIKDLRSFLLSKGYSIEKEDDHPESHTGIFWLKHSN